MEKTPGWEARLEQVRRTLRAESAGELMRFDGKDGREDGAPCHRDYLGGLFGKTDWDRLTPWEKLCYYKTSGSEGTDCDASLRSTVIYQLAFGYGGPSEIVPNGKHCLLRCGGLDLRGDTMNSYSATVHRFLRDYGHDKERVQGFLEKTPYGWGTCEKYNRSAAHWEACILENYGYFSEILPLAGQEFIRLYHTVGNFTVWPKVCNGLRGRGPVKDYWDLTLRCIRQWYQDNERPARPRDGSLLNLFGPQPLTVFRDWLSRFGRGQAGWDRFVERHFLQAFVAPAGGGYGAPKELWDGHFTNDVMPRKEADYEQFFTRASGWIAERGRQIAQAVKAALESGTAGNG